MAPTAALCMIAAGIPATRALDTFSVHADGLVGEATLLAFSHHQTGNIGVGMIATMAWLKIGRVTDRSLGARDVIANGRRRAKQMAWFLEVPWHQWLARPLPDLRRDLGVDRPTQ